MTTCAEGTPDELEIHRVVALRVRENSPGGQTHFLLSDQ